MRKHRIAIAALLLVAAAAPLWAMQEVSAEDYDAAMKSVRATLQGAREHMDDTTALAADGEAFVEAFTTAQTYWDGRNDETALELAAAALTAATRFKAAADAGNTRAVEAAFGELRGTCEPCHESYRERDAEGNWQIKQGGGY